VARVADWSRRRLIAPARTQVFEIPAVAVGPLSEVEARDLLVAADVPVVPAWHVHSGHEAEKVAAAAGVPVAMKIVSRDISHKSDIGGVRLSVEPAAAAAEFESILAA